MKYHFAQTVTLLEQKWLQGAIMPGLTEALQMTEALSKPQGPSFHHLVQDRSWSHLPSSLPRLWRWAWKPVSTQNLPPDPDTHHAAYFPCPAEGAGRRRYKRMHGGWLPWWFRGEYSVFPMQGPRFDPWKGTRSHMLLLRVHEPQVKILHAATEHSLSCKQKILIAAMEIKDPVCCSEHPEQPNK